MLVSGYEARVFSVLPRVVQIDLACDRIVNDVLQNRAEHLRRAINVGLRFGRQFDHFRIAAAFEVEDAIVGPAVLVVADQTSFRIGGERRLAGSR